MRLNIATQVSIPVMMVAPNQHPMKGIQFEIINVLGIYKLLLSNVSFTRMNFCKTKKLGEPRSSHSQYKRGTNFV